VAAKIPHTDALSMLKKALAQSDLFIFHKGTPVKLDVSGIPDPTEQNKAKDFLTKKLDALNCPLKDKAQVEVTASIEGPKSREISYMHAGTYNVQEYFAKLKFSYQGKLLWESHWTNVPGMLSLKKGENVEGKLAEASQKPPYEFFEKIVLPEFLQKPIENPDPKNPQNQGSSTLGQSTITQRGIR
jgi:hypothetical protein